MQGARAETCIVQKEYENKKFQICNSYNRFSLMWEKSKNMNYELEYNGVINLTHTLVEEYFDSLLSFSSIQSGFFLLRIFSFYGLKSSKTFHLNPLAWEGILFFVGPQEIVLQRDGNETDLHWSLLDELNCRVFTTKRAAFEVRELKHCIFNLGLPLGDTCRD